MFVETSFGAFLDCTALVLELMDFGDGVSTADNPDRPMRRQLRLPGKPQPRSTLNMAMESMYKMYTTNFEMSSTFWP